MYTLVHFIIIACFPILIRLDCFDANKYFQASWNSLKALILKY